MRVAFGPILRGISRQKSTFALVVVELAAGFVILSCLTLFGAFILRLGETPSGHDEAQLVAVALSTAGGSGGADGELGRLERVADVEAVAPVSMSLVDDRWYLSFPVQLFRLDAQDRRAAAAPGWVIDTSAALPAVAGLRVIEGRAPPAAAPPGQPARAAIITRCLRDRLFGAGRPAVGARIAAESMTPAEVVAVVEDVVMQSPFLPAPNCLALRFDGAPDARERRYLVRARPGRREAVLAGVAAALGPSGRDREVSVAAFDSSQGKQRAIGRGVALELGLVGATVGASAVVSALALASFLVRQRRRQIGIRRALGATRGDIVVHFLVENGIATALGTAIGLALTLGLLELGGSADRNGYFQWSWWTVAGSALLLWAGTTLGAMLPARRAARVPPSVASRGS